MEVYCKQTKIIFPFSLLYPIHSDNLDSSQGEVLCGSKNKTGIRDLGAGIRSRDRRLEIRENKQIMERATAICPYKKMLELSA